MTSAQRSTIDRLKSEQVGFPPMWEEKDGRILVLLVTSFGGPGRWPSDIELESVLVEPDGTEIKQEILHYVPKGRPKKETRDASIG